MESKDWLKSFSEEEYKAHIKKIQEELKKENLDMMLLSAPENIYYVHGMHPVYSVRFLCLFLKLESQQFIFAF